MNTFLHVGCGQKHKDQTTKAFNNESWEEIRLDIDEAVVPDVVGTMTDMSKIKDSSVDAVFSSHNIEHLYPHEIAVALSEFRRVLNDDGYLVITCPDLQSVCALVAEDKLTEPAYQSSSGPIAPIDILYGHRPAMAKGNLFMAHKSGFTRKVLASTLKECGFQSVVSYQRPKQFDLWAIASKFKLDDLKLRELAELHFPPR